MALAFCVAGKGGVVIGASLRLLGSAVLARGVCAEIALFFWSARPTIGIRGNKNFVVFPKIGAHGYFDHTQEVFVLNNHRRSRH